MKKKKLLLLSVLKKTYVDCPRLIENIAQVTTYTSKVLYIGSLFVNYLVLNMLNKGEDVPITDHTGFIYPAFSIITGNGQKCPEYITNYFTQFKTECEINETIMESLKTIGYSSVITVACKQYETLVKKHVCENHERRSTRLFFELLSDKESTY